MEIKRLLVPTDFSDDACAALETATSFASSLDARIELLHVAKRPVDMFHTFGLDREGAQRSRHDGVGGPR